MRKIVMAAVALALVGVASPGFASGSGASGGGSPQFRGPDGVNSAEQRELQRQFRRGRSQVKKRITCKDCDFYKNLNKNTALEVAQNVIDGKYGLKDEDRTAVLIYLRDRYKL